MKPIFGIKIMTARRWLCNMDYIARLLDQNTSLRKGVRALSRERVAQRMELEHTGNYIDQLRAELDDQQKHIRKLSKLVTHLENEVAKAELTDPA